MKSKTRKKNFKRILSWYLAPTFIIITVSLKIILSLFPCMARLYFLAKKKICSCNNEDSKQASKQATAKKRTKQKIKEMNKRNVRARPHVTTTYPTWHLLLLLGGAMVKVEHDDGHHDGKGDHHHDARKIGAND